VKKGRFFFSQTAVTLTAALLIGAVAAGCTSGAAVDNQQPPINTVTATISQDGLLCTGFWGAGSFAQEYQVTYRLPGSWVEWFSVWWHPEAVHDLIYGGESDGPVLARLWVVNGSSDMFSDDQLLGEYGEFRLFFEFPETAPLTNPEDQKRYQQMRDDLKGALKSEMMEPQFQHLASPDRADKS